MKPTIEKKNIPISTNKFIHDIDFCKFVIHSLPVAVLTVDSELKITSFNAWAEKITGYSEKEVIGCYCGKILHGGRCRGKCPLKPVLEDNHRVVQVETTIKNKKRTAIPVRLTTAGLFDDEGKLIGGLEAFQDISYLKELEREKDNMISMFAHDMKSPLVSIDAFALRSLKAIGRNKKINNYLNIILKEVRKIEFLIDDFLEFSRLQQGKLKLDFHVTSLDKELHELYEVYKLQASKKGMALELHADEPLPIIEADAKRLHRVFSNLLDNAIKFSKKEGTIRIEAQDRDQEIKVTIIDQGIGVDPRDLPYIFEPFHRGMGADKRQGFGVGLAAVKTIIEGHAGKISVKSEKNKGAAFTIILPKTRNLGNEID